MHPVIIIGTVRSLWTDTMGQIPRSTECISSFQNILSARARMAHSVIELPVSQNLSQMSHPTIVVP